MQELALNLKKGSNLLEVLLDDVADGGLFVAGAEHVAAGERVLVRVSLGLETFKLRGRVLWRRTRRGGGGRFGMVRGAAVAFDADQAEAVRRLFTLARAQDVSVVKRESQRLPVSVRIRYNSRFGLARDLVQDLSLGGLRVHTDAPPAVGAPIVIFLRPPRSLFALRLVGEVVWSQPAGIDPGFGVRFVQTTPRDRKRLQRLLQTLRPK